MAAGKRVRIQSAHGILIPGGPPRNRAMMWRSKSQTVTYFGAALILYGLFCTARNLVRDAVIIPDTDINLDLNSSPFVVTYDEGDPVASDEGCPEYGRYAHARHEPFTGGAFNLPFQRPETRCRKVVIDEVEDVIREMNQTVKDPDLFRLFENCFPNTLDTSITWTGMSETNANEEVRACGALCDLSPVCVSRYSVLRREYVGLSR